MRSRRCCNSDGLTCKSVIINRWIESVSRMINCTYNSTFIFFCDEVCNLLGLNCSYKSLGKICIFVSFLYSDYIAVCGRRTFDCKCILEGVKICIKSVVRIDNCVINILKNVGNLSCFNFLEVDVVRILSDVCYSSSDACVFLKLEKAVLLEKQKCTSFVCGVVRNSNSDFARRTASGKRCTKNGYCCKCECK